MSLKKLIYWVVIVILSSLVFPLMIGLLTFANENDFMQGFISGLWVNTGLIFFLLLIGFVHFTIDFYHKYIDN